MPSEFYLEWTLGFSATRNTCDDGYTSEWSSLLVLNRDIVDELAWFVEFESFITAERGDPWVGHSNAGLTWEIASDTILASGTSWRVARSADDFGFHITFVRRF